MFREEKPKSAITTRRIINIIAVLAVALIFDVLLSGIVFVTRSRETLTSLFFVEGVLFVLVGALCAVRGADTPMDVFIALSRGVASRRDPLRQGYAGKKITSGELAIDVLLVLVGAALIGLAYLIQ